MRPPPGSRSRRRGRPLRPAALGPRAALWRRVVLRRIGAGLIAGVACWLALGPYAARGGPPTASALVVTADLPLGHVLRLDDLAVTALPAEAVPAAALRATDQAAGRPLAAAVTSGEILTGPRVRAAGPPLPAGSRAVHVPLADPAAALRLAAGDHVDLITVADGTVVVPDAVVVDVDRPDAGAFGTGTTARGVTLAVPIGRAGALASAALGPHGGVHVAVRPG